MLAACTTSYQPRGLGGGYEDEALGGDRFRISVRGNGFTGAGTTELYFYRRAAEIANQHGYDGYLVIDLRSGFEPGINGLRPATRGTIEGYKGAAPPGAHPIKTGTATAPTASPHGERHLGTGFVVSPDGIVLTNNHVVPHCQSIAIRQHDGSVVDATVLAADATNDLALLKTSPSASTVAQFRDGSDIRQGEAVVAVGFPLPGTVSSGPILTTGVVNALAGFKNDSREYQISAPVQHGNSGGPLLDQAGNVIGIVSSGLEARSTGDNKIEVPQNVNFAIKASIARSFMDINSVHYVRASTSKPIETPEIGERAHKFIVQIACTT